MYRVTVENLKDVFFEVEIEDFDDAYAEYVLKVGTYPYAITTMLDGTHIMHMHDWRDYV